MPLFNPERLRVWQTGAAVATHTGTASETVLVTVNLPPLGPNDRVEVETLSTFTNNANTKTLRWRLGGLAGTAFQALALTTQQSYSLFAAFQNRNSTSSQVSRALATSSGGWGSGAGAIATMAVDTSVATELVFTIQLANTGDSFTLDSWAVKLVRS